MRFSLKDTSWRATQARLGSWHRWFAWRPVRLLDGDYCWLEFVQRRADFYSSWWHFEYKAIKEAA